VAVAALVILAGCKGPGGSSPAPGGFPALTPSGDHAQYVVVGDACTTNGAVITYNLGNGTTPLAGNLAPLYDVVGATTHLSQPFNVYIDFNGNKWASNYGNASVTKYTVTANGNATPTTISGALTGFAGPTGIYVQQNIQGVNIWLYVADYSKNQIDVFALPATGNVAPTYIIKDSSAKLVNPEALTLDSSGNIWVANAGSGTLEKFTSVGGLTAGTNIIAPLQTIGPAGSSGLGADVTGVYVGPNGNIWATDYTHASVVEFLPSTNGTTTAPILTIAGASTTISEPYNVAVDSGGNVYEVGYNYAAVNIWAASALAAGANNVAPTYTIAGPATKLVCPAGLQVNSITNGVDP
jgi:hypothetical protein